MNIGRCCLFTGFHELVLCYGRFEKNFDAKLAFCLSEFGVSGGPLILYLYSASDHILNTYVLNMCLNVFVFCFFT